MHFTELRNGRAVNPLAPGHLSPYDDVMTPRIGVIQLRRAGTTRALLPVVVRGQVQVVVPVYDDPAPPGPGQWATMPTVPAVVTWRMQHARDGTIVVRERSAFDVRVHVPPRRDFWRFFARGTRQNMATFGGHRYRGQPGVFLFRLGLLDTRRHHDGTYSLVVTARDMRRNRATTRTTFMIYNRAGWPGTQPARHGEARPEARVATDAPRQAPKTIAAAFPRESYRPGARAVLRSWSAARGVSIQVFRVGPERIATVGSQEMQGVPVTRVRRLGAVRPGTRVVIAVGDSPSGLYFAKLVAGARVGFAPFVVAPRTLGERRVAVVLPTRTWQAYNRRDDDGDGRGDTWYADGSRRTVALGRPFLNRGVPRHFRGYDRPFLSWLHRTRRAVDVLSQAELDAATGDELASAYDLIVFPGHHEYVARREYDAVVRYRDLGGNLAFLSANNFYWRIDVHDGGMTRVARWRDLGIRESALIGVEYRGGVHGTGLSPWVVRQSHAGRWLFAGTGFRSGSTFANGGIEVDTTTDASPRSLEVLAEIPHLLGPGMAAQMTYYETPAGARVFAAGAFMLTAALQQRPVQRLLANLWRHLADDEPLARLPPTALRGELRRLPQYPTLEVATATQRAAAVRLRARLRAAARLWTSPAAAKRNGGFGFRRPRRKAGDTALRWYHAWHRGFHTDRNLDPKRPDSLVYADVPGHPLVLVGVMYWMPRGTRGPNPGGPITRWHWHRDSRRGSAWSRRGPTGHAGPGRGRSTPTR